MGKPIPGKRKRAVLSRQGRFDGRGVNVVTMNEVAGGGRIKHIVRREIVQSANKLQGADKERVGIEQTGVISAEIAFRVREQRMELVLTL